jgi:lipoprotein-anchoring transpeptidase ErfK/SrfK
MPLQLHPTQQQEASRLFELRSALSRVEASRNAAEEDSALNAVLDAATPDDNAKLFFGMKNMAELDAAMQEMVANILQNAGPAEMVIYIDISPRVQRLYATFPGGTLGPWPISSARPGYVTVTGKFAPYSLQPMHYSKKYHNSPMPSSIFFRGGYAIHGTEAVSHLGTPASHGCVRLSPTHAAELYRVVNVYRGSTLISIYNSGPLKKKRGASTRPLASL